MSVVNADLKPILFMLSSELFSEFYHEMANKCHDQNSGHGKKIIMTFLWLSTGTLWDWDPGAHYEIITVVGGGAIGYLTTKLGRGGGGTEFYFGTNLECAAIGYLHSCSRRTVDFPRLCSICCFLGWYFLYKWRHQGKGLRVHEGVCTVLGNLHMSIGYVLSQQGTLLVISAESTELFRGSLHIFNNYFLE